MHIMIVGRQLAYQENDSGGSKQDCICHLYIVVCMKKLGHTRGVELAMWVIVGAYMISY